jgi:hypothetical protein
VEKEVERYRYKKEKIIMGLISEYVPIEVNSEEKLMMVKISGKKKEVREEISLL